MRRRPVRLRWRHAAPPEVKLLPLQQSLPPCPPWCRTDHAAHAYDDHLAHYRTVAELDAGRVHVVVVDDLYSGERSKPAIEAYMNDAIGPEEARAFALALLDAAEVAEGGTR